MSDDLEYDHPVLADLKRRVGGSLADNISDEALANEFVYLDPSTRAEALMRADAWLAADDGTNLRKKAQFLNFTRQWRDTDRAMRKVGR